VFAHKPSYGRVPMAGHAPPTITGIGPEMDLSVGGPMARSVSDLSLAFDVLVGAQIPPANGPGAASEPSRDREVRDFRVLLIDNHPLQPVAGAVVSAINRVADRLGALGATVGRGGQRMPDLAQTTEIYLRLLALAIRAPVPTNVFLQIETALAPLLSGRAASDYRNWSSIKSARAVLRQQWHMLFQEWDVVLCPAMPTPAFPHDHSELGKRQIDIDGGKYTYLDQVAWPSLATASGLPATVVPIGRTEHGLPIGAQIIGPPSGDRTTLAFAAVVERDFGGFVAPAGYE
jgi:amidase